MPRAIRTKSGRLRRGVARRRIDAAGPGEVVVLDRGRRMVKRADGSRVRSRNSFTLDFAVVSPLAFDLDVRKLVDELRVNLAEHYSDAPPERKRFLEGMAAQINKLVPPECRMDAVRLAKLVSRAHTKPQFCYSWLACKEEAHIICKPAQSSRNQRKTTTQKSGAHHVPPYPHRPHNQ